MLLYIFLHLKDTFLFPLFFNVSVDHPFFFRSFLGHFFLLTVTYSLQYECWKDKLCEDTFHCSFVEIIFSGLLFHLCICTTH